MSRRIRGLELLFNLEKNNVKSKEDCIVIAIHCLLLDNGFKCVGVGDEWPEEISSSTELLPSGWNTDQSVYSLRYLSTDMKSRILLKTTKMEQILQVDVAMNEDAVASMPVHIENHIDNYSDYSTAYKDLDSLCESFCKDILESFQEPKPKKEPSTSHSKREANPSSSVLTAPLKRPDLRQERDPYQPSPRIPSVGGSHFDPLRVGPPRFPRVGGSDLDPLGGGGGGGMLMDPSSFGIPSRPPLSQFGVGPGGILPRGAVPPGARFDPIMPPMGPRGFRPNPDHMRPPDYDDFFM